VADNQAVIIENMELDLDGSLVSRPPIIDLGVSFPLGATGNMQLLGYYYAPGSVPYLIASDGLNSTYYFTGTSWTLITSTIAASSMAQFNGLAYLLAPVGSANPGGSWSPSAGFVAEPNMPKGEAIVAYKFRLFVAVGIGAVANGTSMYYSKVLGTAGGIWTAAPDFINVGAGDGQNIVQLVTYYQSILIFRSASTYSFQFTSDPASGQISQILPNIGLSDKDAVASYESFLYFMYNDRAYEFINNRATQVNATVPFRAISRSGIYKPYAVSIFGNRAIFSYYDTMFVFNVVTRTWTTWKSPTQGSIGRVIPLMQNSQFTQAICHSSAFVSTFSTTRTNLLNNPSGRRSTTGYTMVGTGTLGQDPGADTYAIANASFPYGSFGILIEAPTIAAKFTPGATYTFSATVYSNTTSIGVSVQGAGVASSSGFVTTPAGAFTRVSTTFVAAASGAVNFYILNGTPIVSGNNVAFRDAQVELGSVATTYLDGSLTDTVVDHFAWSGTVDNSVSTATTRRYAKTLRTTDGITSDAEAFQCTLQTKNYNYNTSASYKRLFWWGADAIFRSNVTAIVTPIVYNYSVTWGQARAASTWGQALLFTWGQPMNGTIAVQTVRNTSGGGAIRKFVKFDKSLRFRQANFKLVFDTDGSSATAPVRIFSLMTYVKVKERVSQTVT
jgi:hypothetical protein